MTALGMPGFRASVLPSVSHPTRAFQTGRVLVSVNDTSGGWDEPSAAVALAPAYLVVTSLTPLRAGSRAGPKILWELRSVSDLAGRALVRALGSCRRANRLQDGSGLNFTPSVMENGSLAATPSWCAEN